MHEFLVRTGGVDPYLEIAKPNFRVDNGETQDVVNERLGLSCPGRHTKNLRDRLAPQEIKTIEIYRHV